MSAIHSSTLIIPGKIFVRRESLLKQFFSWCKAQEKNRLGWLAVVLTGHGCIITPLTVFVIILTGNNMFFWAIAIAAISMSLITNLAALPTKITIPVFFFSL